MNDESASLHDYIDIVYRKKWLIVVVFVSVFLTTLYVVQRQPQRYFSWASIYLESSQNTVGPAVVSLGSGAARPNAPRPLQFYLGIFESRSFQEQVGVDLVEYVSRLGMTDVQARNLARDATGSLDISPGSHAGYFSISVQASSPDIAFAADSIATYLFIERCRQVAQQETDAMVMFTGSQLDSARKNLTRTEDYLQQFRRDHSLFALSGEQASDDGLPIEYTRLVAGYYDARRERQTAKATLEATVRTGDLIEQALDSLSIDRIGRAHPAKEYADVLERIRRARTELRIKEFQEESFRTALDEYEREHPELSAVSLNYVRLTRERAVHERLQNLLMERREELRMEGSAESGGVKVIDLPTHGAPVPSRARLTLILGVVIGLVFGIGVALFWEFVDSNIKSLTEVSSFLGITAIGAIPSIGSTRRRSMNGPRGNRAMLMSEGNPKDPVAEAYRALRTSLMYSTGDHRLSSFVISSTGQSEGKSISTANLAITCAQMGQRTVIVDGDLRRPVQHSLFGLEREGGMTEYLLQDLGLADIAKPSGVENLDIITAGITPPNPAPLLASQTMRDSLAEMKQAYDLVLIDSPPIIAVTDAVLLGRLTDGVLLIVRCASTPRAPAKHAVSILQNSKVPLLGAILNDVDVSRHYGGYYYYNYYYHYYYGSGQGGDAEKEDATKGERA